MKNIGEIRGNPILLNLIALGVALLLYFAVYDGLWEVKAPAWVGGSGLIILLIGVIGLLFAHEAIHMLAARLCSREAKASLKFNILQWECRLKGPLCRNQYIVYALAPAIVLGLTGILGHAIFASPDYKFIAAIIFLGGVSSAGGDFWFVSKILRYSRKSLVFDHGIEVEIISPAREEPI